MSACVAQKRVNFRSPKSLLGRREYIVHCKLVQICLKMCVKIRDLLALDDIDFRLLARIQDIPIRTYVPLTRRAGREIMDQSTIHVLNSGALLFAVSAPCNRSYFPSPPFRQRVNGFEL